MISAENKHRKLRVTAIECSPELSKLILRRKFQCKLLHYKQGRFNNTAHLQSTSKYLHITSYNNPLVLSIGRLKTSKLYYLHFKKHKFINSAPERKEEIKVLRKRENLKAKWKLHRLDFGKSRMNSMSEIQCAKYGLMTST